MAARKLIVLERLVRKRQELGFRSFEKQVFTCVNTMC